MLYRVEMNLTFENEADAQDVFDKAKGGIGKAVEMQTRLEPTGEIGYVEIHKCYHDETPVKPCETIKRIEV